jgi:hypothetical protein
MGTIDTSTLMNAAFSVGNPRAATSNDGSAFWVSGSNSGVHYVTLGSTGSSVQVSAAPTNLRHIHIFGGQLYVSSASGSTFGVLSVGTGTPTTTGQTAALLPGFPTATGPQPYSFAVLDLSSTVAGVDTIYVAQDAGPGAGLLNVQKWVLSGANWTLQTTFAPTLTGATTAGVRGLAAQIVGTDVRVVAVTNETPSRLVTFLDNGVSNAPTVTVLSTAATNTAYRGVAFSPIP